MFLLLFMETLPFLGQKSLTERTQARYISRERKTFSHWTHHTSSGVSHTHTYTKSLWTITWMSSLNSLRCDIAECKITCRHMKWTKMIFHLRMCLNQIPPPFFFSFSFLVCMMLRFVCFSLSLYFVKTVKINRYSSKVMILLVIIDVFLISTREVEGGSGCVPRFLRHLLQNSLFPV